MTTTTTALSKNHGLWSKCRAPMRPLSSSRRGGRGRRRDCVTIVTASSSSSSSSSCHQKNGAVLKTEGEGVKEDERETSATSPRRRVLKNAMSAAAGGVLFFCGGFGEKRANAGVMGSIAGRVPGFGKVGSDGSMWYTRPEAKSGGHGIGWTDITPYSLKLREGWEEVAVSIADPGGTEIDTRFKNESEGDVKIVLAPVLRFANVQDGENPTIEELVPITNLILGFAPEVLGQPVNEEQIKSMEKDTRNGLTHYNYEISNDAHWLISATVWKKRVYLCAVHANGRQWRTAQPKLRETIESFVVVK